MNRRIVDVFLQDRLIASYPIVIEDGRTNVSSEDFIDKMKQRMRERDSSFDVALAKFVVRRTSE
ncbi:MAG: hypothetical protein J0J01_20560 [Reyranella sp.]|uniref:hypothetical protein n=1 Tax=Reyranella sp. TaxID=1929291 RepID=UPI001AC81E8A|nr:hypothetical protein [Reyranella sp.]MBN9089308.1 hypothetical protein [Reyranella sp.]